MPSPSFSSCWKELGCLRLSMVAVGTVWPPPRLRTLMEESVRATETVPAWVGLSFPGGARVVCLGSQRMALAVVSWLAMRSGVVARERSWGVCWAVLWMGTASRGPSGNK